MPARATEERVRAWAPYVLTALLIWLAWQIVLGLLVQRAPAEIAIRVAPGSSVVLSRTAEAELVAGRVDQARDLAEMALRAAPFDVRALRILGLSIARTDEVAADPILTLAGNWSLRDDPSHAWLMQRRLRQGDYVGSFGHADTLARRREDLRPGLFRYFAAAAAEDPRAVPALLQRYSAVPNWRPGFFEFLRTAENGPSVQAALAVGLDDRAGHLSNTELEVIYLDWLKVGRLPGVLALRERMGRPEPAPLIDGHFNGVEAPQPFRWNLITAPGVTPTLSEDRSRIGQHALFVESDGFQSTMVASQLVTLRPGRGELSFSAWIELGGDDALMQWTLTCVETGQKLADMAIVDAPDWREFRATVDVPPLGCTAQWLRLRTTRGPRRTSVLVWIDDMVLKQETVG